MQESVPAQERLQGPALGAQPRRLRERVPPAQEPGPQQVQGPARRGQEREKAQVQARQLEPVTAPRLQVLVLERALA